MEIAQDYRKIYADRMREIAQEIEDGDLQPNAYCFFFFWEGAGFSRYSNAREGADLYRMAGAFQDESINCLMEAREQNEG